MRYTKSAYDAAEQIMQDRLRKAEEERAERIEEIRQKLPEVYSLFMSMRSVGYGMLSVIGSGVGREDARAKMKALREQNESTRETVRGMLRSFGYPEDYLEYHYFCSTCSDRGYKEGKRCGCMEKLLKEQSIRELNKNCSIKLHDFSEFDLNFYRGIKQEGYDVMSKMEMIYRYCVDYSMDFREDSPSMLFYGKTGLGKTFLSSCIAKYLIEQGYTVFFGSIIKFFRQLEDEQFGRKEGNSFEIISDADLVILDDLGSEFKTSFTESKLYEILNERMNSGKPVIVSTNIDVTELDKKYNERIVSRLVSFTTVEFMGNDIRQEIRRLGR
ncbi:MAG: ATP-binding protein [Ruminococcus sp.]|nr:ATP-binding protein [Ruminococcus sp.]